MTSATSPPVPHRSSPPLSVAARTLSVPVRAYQAVRAGRPSPCRYWPTCSDYALAALADHGAARGLWLTGRRLLRCHPWARSSGFDPVPEAAR
jgi:putative membrane protein insertion efficiency factor